MKRALFLFFVTFGFSCYAHAQDFKEGYIVTVEGDTLRGTIRKGTNEELSEEIQYIGGAFDWDSETYTTADLLGFGFDTGRTFVRMSTKDERSSAGDSVQFFAKKNIDGKINMYTWHSQRRNEPDVFLINNKTQRKARLIQPEKKVVTRDDGKQYRQENKGHITSIGYILSDSLKAYKAKSNLRYNEQAIEKSILSYNEMYEDDFPMKFYKPEREFKYNVTVGMPVTAIDAKSFRGAIYRNRYFPEKSRVWSFFYGLSYRYYHDDDDVSDQENVGHHFRSHFISIVPFGIHVQSNSGSVKPYVYGGFAIIFEISDYYNIVDYENLGNDTRFNGYPFFNFGTGIKVRMGKSHLLLEITPTVPFDYGLFVNLGVSL